MTPQPLKGFFAVCDPDGHIDHTTVSTDYEGAIEFWLGTERSMNHLANAFLTVRGERQRCLASWEGYESQGYRVVQVDLIPSEVVHANNI